MIYFSKFINERGDEILVFPLEYQSCYHADRHAKVGRNDDHGMVEEKSRKTNELSK